MFNKKPLLYAGISGILLFIIPIFFNLLGIFVFPEFFLILSGILSLVLSVFFLYGFYYLGLKYKSKLLSVISCVGIIFLIVLYIGLLFLSGPITHDAELFNQTYTQQQIVYDNLNVINASSDELVVLENEMINTLMDFLVPYAIGLLILVFVWLFASVLFDIALIRLKKVEYAKITGIIGIFSVALTLTIFGILLAMPLLFAYYIMIIIILFNEAKKFREYR
jgi:hypothetical protein